MVVWCVIWACSNISPRPCHVTYLEFRTRRNFSKSQDGNELTTPIQVPLPKSKISSANLKGLSCNNEEFLCQDRGGSRTLIIGGFFLLNPLPFSGKAHPLDLKVGFFRA